jgi:hypothetical protein
VAVPVTIVNDLHHAFARKWVLLSMQKQVEVWQRRELLPITGAPWKKPERSASQVTVDARYAKKNLAEVILHRFAHLANIAERIQGVARKPSC